MKKLLIAFSCATLLTGCLGPNKVNKWVNTHYRESSTPKMKNDYLSIASSLPVTDPVASVTTKQTKNFLPLLFYWQYDYINTCTLNPSIPIHAFSTAVLQYAGTKGLKQKLNGRKIELVVDSIPHVFILNDKGHLIWVIYAFGWDDLSFKPDTKEMIVSYKITQDNTEIKTGIITIPNTDKQLDVRYMQSLKKAADQYLDQYDENIKSLSRKVVDKLMAEL
jgi:hypothetical protein